MSSHPASSSSSSVAAADATTKSWQFTLLPALKDEFSDANIQKGLTGGKGMVDDKILVVLSKEPIVARIVSTNALVVDSKSTETVKAGGPYAYFYHPMLHNNPEFKEYVKEKKNLEALIDPKAADFVRNTVFDKPGKDGTFIPQKFANWFAGWINSANPYRLHPEFNWCKSNKTLTIGVRGTGVDSNPYYFITITFPSEAAFKAHVIKNQFNFPPKFFELVNQPDSKVFIFETKQAIALNKPKQTQQQQQQQTTAGSSSSSASSSSSSSSSASSVGSNAKPSLSQHLKPNGPSTQELPKSPMKPVVSVVKSHATAVASPAPKKRKTVSSNGTVTSSAAAGMDTSSSLSSVTEAEISRRVQMAVDEEKAKAKKAAIDQKSLFDTRFAQLEAEKDQLNQQKREVDRTVKEQELQIQQLKADVQQSKARNAELVASNAKIAAQLQQKESEYADLEVKFAESKKQTQEDADTLKRDKTHLQAMLDGINTDKEEEEAKAADLAAKMKELSQRLSESIDGKLTASFNAQQKMLTDELTKIRNDTKEIALKELQEKLQEGLQSLLQPPSSSTTSAMIDAPESGGAGGEAPAVAVAGGSAEDPNTNAPHSPHTPTAAAAPLPSPPSSSTAVAGSDVIAPPRPAENDE